MSQTNYSPQEVDWVAYRSEEGQVYWVNKKTQQYSSTNPYAIHNAEAKMHRRFAEKHNYNYQSSSGPSRQQGWGGSYNTNVPYPAQSEHRMHAYEQNSYNSSGDQMMSSSTKIGFQTPNTTNQMSVDGHDGFEIWIQNLHEQLQSSSITELERRLGQMGVRAGNVGSKQQLINNILDLYISKQQKGELPLQDVQSNTYPRGRSQMGYEAGEPPRGDSHPSRFDNQVSRPPPGFTERTTPQPPLQAQAPPPKTRSPNQSDTRPLRKAQPSRRTTGRSENNQVNWGAVRQLHDGKWQTRTPNGTVLPELFKSREEATEFLRQRKRKQEIQTQQQISHNNRTNKFHKGDPTRAQSKKSKPPEGKVNNRSKHNKSKGQTSERPLIHDNRPPSPPAYIPPMPADLFDDEDDDEEEDDALLVQRPEGREIPSSSGADVQRVVLTSSVELRSEYQHGFEEWKPSKPWEHEDVAVRVQVRNEFAKINRTAIITATGVIYTEKNEDKAINKLPITNVIFTRTVRYPDKPKFLIRLQHAVEHQLAVALYRANFTRMSGETTPMYVFMAQSSGQEIRLQMGKTITNFSGVVPHVKIRSQEEIHLEMVPSEKSFLTKTVRDMMGRGKMKNFFKDNRALVRTSSKLLTVTIVQISDQKSMEAYDPTTNMTVTDMAKLRGAAFTYEDAVVVETTHGLFSSDEIYPSARLNKKEQAARDKQLKKHRYCDRQQAHFDIVVQFKEELWESIRRQEIGVRINHDLICAPCTYLPEVQVKRSGGPDGESIGSKSRHHEWDRILRKPPAKLKLDNLTVIYDVRFREVKTLKQIFSALTKTNRRPWIPYPKFFQCNLADLCKLWEQRPHSMIRLTMDANVDKQNLESYFSQFGLISSLTVKGKFGSVQFRTSACVPSILAKGIHIVNGVNVTVEPFLKLNQHQRKMFMPTLSAIQKTAAIMVFLPGREGSPVATMIKNKMTMMINGEEGLNPCALQFVMAGYIKPNSKRALPILQEAIEAGLVPKTGAITFEIDKKRCEFDLVIAIDVSTEHHGQRVASIVATNKPYEGSLSGMRALVTKVDSSQKIGDLICYDQMKHILEKVGLTGANILLYRHNACVDSKALFSHEIQACVDHFKGSHVTMVEVTSHTSLRVLDVEYPKIKGNQAKSEFIITQKVTRTCKKCIDFYIRHISKSNPVRYSIVFSTNRDILREDDEILEVAHFTHHLTKNYVHHKDGSKLPGPLKYADHISRFYSSILKTLCRDNNRLPRFHPKSLRPRIVT